MTHELRWAGSPDAVQPSSIYSEPAYLEMFAEVSGATVQRLEGRHEGKRFSLPLLVRELEGGAREAFSAYGYGGISSEGSPLGPIDSEAVQRFLEKEGILDAFIRHSPFLENQAWWPESRREFNRTCYVRDLREGMDLDAFALAVEQKLRWSINYARKAGLVVSFVPADRWESGDVSAFHGIYSELMMAKETDPSYLFPESFFQGHRRFESRCELALIRSDASGDILAAAFFLLDPGTGWVHYHLSASQRDRLRYQPMELMLAAASVHYGNRGFHSFHLGGGHSPDGQDGLSRFKRKFATHERPFFVSKLVCDPDGYESARTRLPLARPGLFLISDARGRR